MTHADEAIPPPELLAALALLVEPDEEAPLAEEKAPEAALEPDMEALLAEEAPDDIALEPDEAALLADEEPPATTLDADEAPPPTADVTWPMTEPAPDVAAETMEPTRCERCQ